MLLRANDMEGCQLSRGCGWKVDWTDRGLAVSIPCLRKADILSQKWLRKRRRSVGRSLHRAS
eukprot:9326305-Pyramimonas_sp.AAC.1